MIEKYFSPILTDPSNNISENVQSKLNEALRYTILNKCKSNIDNSENKHVFTNENVENGGVINYMDELPITVDDITKTLDAFEMLNHESDINMDDIKRLITKKVKNINNYLTCQVPETLEKLEKIQVSEGVQIGLTSDKFLLDTYMIKESCNNLVIPIHVATNLQNVLKNYQNEFPNSDSISNLSKDYSKFLLESFENIELVHTLANFNCVPIDELSKITLPRVFNLTMSYIDKSITRDSLMDQLDKLGSNIANIIKSTVNNYLSSSWENLKTNANYDSFKTFLLPQITNVENDETLENSKVFYHRGYYFLLNENGDITDFVSEKEDTYIAEQYGILKLLNCALVHNYDKNTNTFYFDVLGGIVTIGENGVTFNDELIPEIELNSRINNMMQFVTTQNDLNTLQKISLVANSFKNLVNTNMISLKSIIDANNTAEIILQKLEDETYNLISFNCGNECCGGNCSKDNNVNEKFEENYTDTCSEFIDFDCMKFYSGIKADAVLDLVYTNLGYVPYGIVAGTSTEHFEGLQDEINTINDKLIELAGFKGKISDYIEKIEFINSELSTDVPGYDELMEQMILIKEDLEHDLTNAEDEIKKLNLEKEELESEASSIVSYATTGAPSDNDIVTNFPPTNNMDILPTNVINLRKKYIDRIECPLEINDKVKILLFNDDTNLAMYGYVYNISSFGDGAILVSTPNGIKTYTFDDYNNGKLIKL